MGSIAWPEATRTPEAERALADWVTYRKQIRKPVRSQQTLDSAVGAFAGRPEALVAAVRHSIAQGWQGLFEPSGGTPPDHNAEVDGYLARLTAPRHAKEAP